MPEVLTVGSKSLAAGFATGDDYTRTAECNRCLSFDERAPHVPFKFGLRFRKDLVFVHFDRVASAREYSNPPRNILLHGRWVERSLLSQGHEIRRLPRILFESFRYCGGRFNLLPLPYDRSRPQLGAQDPAPLRLLTEDPANDHA